MADGYISQIKTLDNKVYLLKDSEKTDEKVKQTSNAEDKEFPIILKNTNNTTNETACVKYTSGITVNPSNKTITATKLIFNNTNNYINNTFYTGKSRFSYHASAAHASINTGGSGWLKVKIKKKASWMLTFTIRLYTSYAYYDYAISGYNYGSNHWHSPTAVLLGSNNTDNRTVKFGYDDDAENNYCTLWVAVQAGNYYGIDIFNVTNGHSQYISDIENMFEIIHEDELTGTQQGNDQTIYGPWRRNETVTSATTAGNISGILALANLTKGDANTALMGKGSSTAPAYVSVSPSISITAGTADNAPKVNLTVLGVSGTAQELTKATTGVYGATKLSSAVNSSSEVLAATPKAVKVAYDQATTALNTANNLLATADAMVFKGTLGTGGTITTVPTGASGKEYQAGYTYKIITEGTYAGNVCEVGDLLIAIADSTSGQSAVNNAHWTVVQSNLERYIHYYNNHDNNIDSLIAIPYLQTAAANGGSWSGTKPSNSHNGMALFNFQTHSGNYYTQLALDTNQNRLWLRSANNATAFGAWSKIATIADIEALDVSNISGFGTTKTLKTLTQTDGKIAATFQDIAFPVTSVAGKTGAVTLAKGDVGLGNVDNTADANKSVNYATSAGSATNADTATHAKYFTGTINGGVTIDANNPGDTLLGDYGSSGSTKSNLPSGWAYGSLLTLGAGGAYNSLSSQFAWDVQHNTDHSGRLWFRTNGGKSSGSGWKDWTEILTANRTYAPSSTPTLAWNTESTIFTLNGTEIKIKAMAKPTYTYSDVGAAPSSTVSCTTANVKTALGTGSGTVKFLREDGTWQTPAYTTNTDEKLKIAAVTSGTTYYPIVAANATTAATRQYDATGFAYLGTDGTTSAVGVARITLGNSTASGTAKNKQGSIALYGSTAYLTTIVSGAPTAANTLTLPTASGTIALTSDITHHTAYLYAGANDATAHAAVSSGTNIYLCLRENGTQRSAVQIKQGSNMTISSDANGVITFANAYSYSLPLAADGTRGGIQIGYTQSGKNYPVQLSSEKAYVNVPWTDTNNAVTQAYSTTNNSYPLLMTATAGITSTSSRGDTTSILNNVLYANPSTGQLNATTFKVNEQVTLEWNSTDSSLDFVFA